MTATTHAERVVDSRRYFLGITTIVFAASAATTIAWCASMAEMGQMQMPGGWTMSHMWMVMPGQTWLGATASFVGMWVVMMVAMMLPSLAPALWRYRQTIRAIDGTPHDWLTAVVGLGYFATWAVVGLLVFPLGIAVADTMMRTPDLARQVPLAGAAIVVIAGIVQLTVWKARRLALCREPGSHDRTLSSDVSAAWTRGLWLGLHCVRSCAGLTAVALMLGIMDLRVMAAMTIVVTVERFALSDTTTRIMWQPGRDVPRSVSEPS